MREEDNGGCFWPVGKKNVGSKHEEDEEMAKKLWEWSEEALEGYLP